ncbi:hypothetical protein AVEN_107418-1 [Araneus ventricosus]|uniref:Uncharacterized protein n=1 Tax=Araneus ventricosus TaxID=182803 RepID=A0A4Y2JB71_ARAVE|nr:hypothetical protein AVEN_107418-1 [Araneus ventricosus]
MSQPLPVSDFEWLSPEEISLQQICQTPDDATTGYILEVDMEYPPELHALHNSYPLALKQWPSHLICSVRRLWRFYQK